MRTKFTLITVALVTMAFSGFTGWRGAGGDSPLTEAAVERVKTKKK